MIRTVGSICSGIEAASVAWKDCDFDFKWFSEILPFANSVLESKYPHIPNLGDMTEIPNLIAEEKINTPDLICGGTPCQAFSFAGWKQGLNDDRGNLTLKFVDIINANDEIRERNHQAKTVVFWENVEGVLRDKTNAFGCFISSLAGLDEVIMPKRWANAGILRGPKRNVAWRILDAKHFGLPQQRRRLYLLAGGADFFPENVLFELSSATRRSTPVATPLIFEKDGHTFEIFREYTDCLYSAYGTKWNGNAAANNGSLFVVQDGRIRRFSALECERLMGFPDGYTDIPKARKTNRYQALGNSWAVPVVRWLGNRLNKYEMLENINALDFASPEVLSNGKLFQFDKNVPNMGINLNCSDEPNNPIPFSLKEIVSPDAPQDIYISPVGCFGIVRRKNERGLKINQRLEDVLLSISSEMTPEDIERRSRVQKRGRLSSQDSQQKELF